MCAVLIRVCMKLKWKLAALVGLPHSEFTHLCLLFGFVMCVRAYIWYIYIHLVLLD